MNFGLFEELIQQVDGNGSQQVIDKLTGSMQYTEIDKIYDRLDRLMNRYDTEDILSGIIEYQFMDLNDSLRLNKAELIAGRLIKFDISNSKYSYLFRESEKMLELADDAIACIGVKDMFDIGMKIQDETDEEKKKVEKSVFMKSKYILMRGDGYVKQLIEFAEQLYSKFDNEIKQAFGFTYTQCQSFIIYIYQEYHRRTDEMNRNFLKNVNSPIFKKIPIDENYVMQSIQNNYIYRISKTQIYEKFEKNIADNIIYYLSVKLGQDNKSFNNINDFNILYSKPLVDFGEYIYLVLPINAIQNLPKLFHYEFITNKKISKEIKGRYTNWRGTLLEDLTVKYMKRVFNKNNIYQSLYYYENGQRFEADVTVQERYSTILCECKSKLLVLDSLRGKLESIEKDFEDAIGKAYEQAVRTHNWILNENEFELVESDDKIKKIKLKKAQNFLKICIVADHFGWIPSNIKDYIKIEDNKELPLVINIYDLDILTKEAKSFEEFIRYLNFRRDFQDKIISIDELEIFCASKDDKSLYEKAIDKDIVFVDGYTEKIDKKYYIESSKWLMKYDVKVKQ